MLYDLIICRSLTYAQRTAEIVERAGVTARVLRTPQGLTEAGCSHCVKISQRRRTDALVALYQAQLPPKRLFAVEPDGSYREVPL